ncbi:MAG: hypothetical protein EXS35_02195 [Pedosphaera sp.]|nr:hypothetical protein [Pedosphaera sp.]
MKKALQAVASLVAVAAVGTWLATGAHRGWTKTSVQKMTLDEVTGIESPSYEKKFVAGVDFLGAGLLAAGGLAGISLFFRHQKKPD